MKVVVLGATKGMGRALARRLASRGDALFLLGRDEAELARSASELEVLGAPKPVGYGVADLGAPEGFARALDEADAALERFDAVIVTAGDFASQEVLESDAGRLRRLLEIDYTHTVLFCEEARKRLMACGGGTLCVFSSVAGDRARKPVILYGAAKAGLSYYLEGLDHKFRSAGLRTVTVKPGFVRTGMTAGLQPPPFAGEPDEVARRVLRAIDRGAPVVYAPPIWALVMLVIRALPRAVMRRIGF